jgi:hypothetical protein
MNIGDTFFGNSGGSTFKNLSGVGSTVTLFINIAFVLAGIVLLFFFILGGIGMIGSAGQDNPQKAEQSKKTLTSAVIGFVIVFASYWIVKLIGQLIGMPNII